MGKVESYPQRKLGALQKQWVRDNRGPVAIIVGGAIALIVAESALLTWLVSGRLRYYLLGLMHASITATALYFVRMTFLASSKEAIWQLRGAWGEDNTRDQLRRAKRQRVIWGWVDSINLQSGDLDHVVVTRRGGLVAIDTKWRNDTTTNANAEMARAAQRVRLRAEGLTRTVLDRERGARHRAKAEPVRVTAVVVVWGREQRRMPNDAVVDGISFVGGRQLLRWLRALDGDSVSKAAGLDLLDRLKQFRDAGARHFQVL